MIKLDIAIILPELLIAVYAMGALITAVYTKKDSLARPIIWLTMGIFIVLAVLISISAPVKELAFNNMFVNDGFTCFVKVVILAAAAAILAKSPDYLYNHKILRFEFPLLVCFSVVGMMIMVSSTDLIVLYMGLELQSLSLYVITSMRSYHPKSTEAGLKYFVLGALSSGLLLYGMSLTYGYAGTTSFEGILLATKQGNVRLGLLLGLVLIIAGMAFKISAVPFHMWAPDVYEGAPTPVTGFLATAPKIAAIATFARIMHDAFGSVAVEWQQVIALISLLSMFLGAVAAIGQDNIKRLMAYSSISHMGYALMGLAAGSAFGIEAMLIYMVIYVTMNIGTFAFILTMKKEGQQITNISSLKMLSSKEPGKALAMLVLLFSLAGVPPSLGFFAKFQIWQSAVEADMVWLVLASAMASAIGAFYYLRIVYLMYFGDEPEEYLESFSAPVLSLVLFSSAFAMIIGLFGLFGLEGAAKAAAFALVN